MLPGSTLFLAVCTQRDYWPGGAWPLVDDDTAAAIAELFALAARLDVREGAVVCCHDGAVAAAIPAHCRTGAPGSAPAPGCAPARPNAIVTPGALPALDRDHTYEVASGCAVAVDDDAAWRAAFDHLTAGIRDA